MATKSSLADKIVLAAIELAEDSSWESVRLFQVAEKLQINLADIHDYYPDKEAIADAWFEQANKKMLHEAKKPTVQALPVREKLHYLMMARLDGLGTHRRVTREMVYAKLEPGHLHIQIGAIIRISRAVQWLREACGLQSTGLRRGIDETILTAIFLKSFIYWLYDDSNHSKCTRELLDRDLRKAEKVAEWFDYLCV